MTDMDDRTGAITLGKAADIILVDGDVPQSFGNLRNVRTYFLMATGSTAMRCAKVVASAICRGDRPVQRCPQTLEQKFDSYRKRELANGTAAIRALNNLRNGWLKPAIVYPPLIPAFEFN